MESDHRLRLEAKKGYRVVAPEAKKINNTTYINDYLIIEKVQNDALGNPAWVTIGRMYLRSEGYRLEDDEGNIRDREELAEALYALLSGDAEEKEPDDMPF